MMQPKNEKILENDGFPKIFELKCRFIGSDRFLIDSNEKNDVERCYQIQNSLRNIDFMVGRR